MLEDVQRILEALESPPNRLIVFGRSVGSLFAVRAVKNSPEIAGLILESAIADPLERLLLRVRPEELGITADVLELEGTGATDIQRSLGQFKQPCLILHTLNDGLIDVRHAEQLARWCGGPVHLEIFERGNHNNIMYVNGPR